MNTSDETPYKILSLPIAEFNKGNGEYLIRLTQKGYAQTDVKFLLAPRTQIPSPNKNDGGYVYLSDGKLTVETEKDTTLTISFLLDPRLEDGIVTLAPKYITQDTAGKYTADFQHLRKALKNHRHVKIIAQTVGKAPSDIVTVRLIANRVSANPTPVLGMGAVVPPVPTVQLNPALL